jgi:DNA ligase (NAD+)
VAKKLARYFKNIDALMAATPEELKDVEEIGERISESVIDFFSDSRNRQIVERLREQGLQLSEKERAISGINTLGGKAFVVSGKFEHHSRDGIKEAVELNGGRIVSSISTKTDFVIAGMDMGPAKLKKAESLGISIISEDEFQQMISL